MTFDINDIFFVCVCADLFSGLLSYGRVAGRGHGEQQRGGAPPHQAGQVSAAPARELRPLAQVCLLW